MKLKLTFYNISEAREAGELLKMAANRAEPGEKITLHGDVNESEYLPGSVNWKFGIEPTMSKKKEDLAAKMAWALQIAEPWVNEPIHINEIIEEYKKIFLEINK